MPHLVTDGLFYAKYQTDNSSFHPDTFTCAETTIAKLLDTATTSENPGILLGKVQSGKTRTFISAIALAFDNGFDIAIVLTKNSRALAEQTLKRLDAEFRDFVVDADLHIYDIMRAPTSYTNYELESKLVFVAKKQSDNLSRLTTLFRQHCPGMASHRVLIVDDEADNASIGYTKREGLIQANKIAAQVSELRSAMQQSSFLQVTATPYSLYLQPTEIEVANTTEFKPTRPAFTVLAPVPAEYVGGETYFGDAARDDTETIERLIHRPVDHNEFDRLKKRDGRKLKLEDVLTSGAIAGYRSAIVTFLVGGVIQRINGDQAGAKLKRLLYSFLLHSEASRGSHEWQETVTRKIIDDLKVASSANAVLFEQLVREPFDDLRRSLLLAQNPVPEFPDIVAAVRAALEGDQITITKVNSDEDVAALLDSTGQLKLRSPFNIFIGGQVIDRGITLAGLIGFYYGRRPNKFQQDTVLQHSRMYGYRRPDLPVTRFWTSPGIRHVMFQMEDFDAALRKAIEDGGDQAVQFIRKADDGRIIPCSPNKVLIATTQTLRPHRRLLPIGFQSGYRTGEKGIGKTIEKIDGIVEKLCGFNTENPVLVTLDQAVELLSLIEPTLQFIDEDAPPFDWDAARAVLRHLSHQSPDPTKSGRVFLWAARNRKASRMASPGSHVKYIETPDSEKTEGQLAKEFAIENPILFLLRQDGEEPEWRGTPFYWPVIRAQKNTPTAVYTSEIVG